MYVFGPSCVFYSLFSHVLYRKYTVTAHLHGTVLAADQ